MIIFFLSQLLIPRIYAVGSKLLNLEVFLREILFYIFCGSDVDIRRYGWDYLFQKSSVDGGENLVVGIEIEINYRNYSRAKK